MLVSIQYNDTFLKLMHDVEQNPGPTSFRTPLTISSLEPAPAADSTLICDTDGVSKWMPRSVLYAGDVNNIYKPYVMLYFHTQAVGCCNTNALTGVLANFNDMSQYDRAITSLATFTPTTDNGRRIISIATGTFKGLSLSNGACFDTESVSLTVFIVWRRTGSEAPNTDHYLFESSGNEISLRGNENNGYYTVTFDGNSWNTSASSYTNDGNWTLTSMTIDTANEKVIIRQNTTVILDQAWTASDTEFNFTSGSVALFSNSAYTQNAAMDCGTFLVVDTYADMTAVENIEKNLLYQWGSYSLLP